MGGVPPVFLIQATALLALLLAGVLVYRAFPQRYLLLWNAGWLIYLGHMFVAVLWPEAAGGLLSTLLLLGAQAVMAAAVGIAAGRENPLRLLLPLAGVAALAEVIVSAAAPSARGWPASAGYLVLGLLAATWVVQFGRRRHGLGPSLLAVALLLRLIHLPELAHDAPLLRLHIPEATSSILAMLSMLVLAIEAARHHLRWSAAPGVVASVAANYTAPGRFGQEAFDQIAEEIRRLFEPDYSRLFLLPATGISGDPEGRFLLSVLPRAGRGPNLSTTVLRPGRSPETSGWLQERALRWAVVVPIPRSGDGTDRPAGLFVLGYRTRHWISPETMDALVATGRQLGMVFENSRLIQQLSHAYREWLNTMDAIGDLVIVHDAEFRIQRVNRAMAERVGRIPTDMIQRLCRDMLPNSGLWRNCPFCELSQEGDTFDEDFRAYLLVSTSRYPREDPSGVLHVVKDITDRKRAEEKYRTMFEKVHEGVFISTADGRFVEINEAFARMLGYTREELLNVYIPSLYYEPGDRERYLKVIRGQGYVSEYEVRLRRKDGEQIIGLETSFGTSDESGQLVQFQGFLLDITARKIAEEQLRRHAEMLAAVNELAEELTGSLDAQNLMKVVAREVPRIFGFDTVAAYIIDKESNIARCVAAEGFRLAEGQAPEALQAPADFLAALQAERRGVLPPLDMAGLARDLLALYEAQGVVSLFALPMQNSQMAGGLILGLRERRALTQSEETLLGAITRQLDAALENAALYQQTREAFEELRRTQEQLLQSEKMAALGQLVSGVAHELNNPLTAIIGYSQLLGSQVGGKANEYVDKLMHQARRTQRIISNLLSFSRQSKPERQLLDLNRVIEDTLVLREYDLRVGNMRIERKLTPNLPAVEGDVHQLEQVFLNIVNNAYDAMREGGQGGILRVVTRVEDSYVIVEFADNGPGMKETGRVFDPFYTTKSVGKGTGLGLSICYGIIKEHSGEITAHNNPDAGATFRVRLPAKPASASADMVG